MKSSSRGVWNQDLTHSGERTINVGLAQCSNWNGGYRICNERHNMSICNNNQRIAASVVILLQQTLQFFGWVNRDFLKVHLHCDLQEHLRSGTTLLSNYQILWFDTQFVIKYLNYFLQIFVIWPLIAFQIIEFDNLIIKSYHCWGALIPVYIPLFILALWAHRANIKKGI